MKRKNGVILLLAAALCLMLALPAGATETGSITVCVEELGLDVVMHKVAGIDGVLNDSFSGAAISPETMLDSRESEVNAAALYKYALEQKIPGEEKTSDAQGKVYYSGLQEGCYLVYCLQADEFDPFLVFMPTVINGEAIYDVISEPKSSEEDETEPTTVPTEPDESTEPTKPEPEIPQTGFNMIPKYILLALGAVVTVAGVVELIRGRKGKHE